MTMFPPPAPVPSLSITPNIPEIALAQFILVVVFWFIALVAVLLRIYARLMKDGVFFLNDYAVFWAFLWASGSQGANLALSLQGALGQHISVIQELAPERIATLAKLFLVVQITWAPANAGVKLSIIDLYLKLFGTNRKFRVYSYVLVGFVLSYVVLVTLLICFICIPFAFNWDRTIEGGHCADIRADFLATGIVNFVLDICVIALPMPTLWGLKMRLRKKLGLGFMFSIGFIICGITMWRLVAIQEYDFNDPYFSLPYPVLTSALEPLLGITNATLPILVAPFSALKSRLSAWRKRNTGDLAGRGTANIRPTAENSHSYTNNFNRLYDHLFPLSNYSAQSQTATCVREPELQSKFSKHGDKVDTIELTTA